MPVTRAGWRGREQQLSFSCDCESAWNGDRSGTMRGPSPQIVTLSPSGSFSTGPTTLERNWIGETGSGVR